MKSLYQLINEHSTVSNGVRTFTESQHAYKQNFAQPGTGQLQLSPIIDGIVRTDKRITGLPDDVYAAVLREEGIIS